MNRRYTYIENRRVLSDSGEITINIDVRDPVSALILEMRATNGASGNVNNPLPGCITAVEIISGSEVLVSLTGVQLAALTAYTQGHMPYTLVTEVPSNIQNMYGLLLFGRWFGDAAYALNPSRFPNLQMRFKWDLAAVTAVGVTGYVTGTATLTVIADVMEGAENPIAMLVSKQHYNYTTVASGNTYIDLPVDKRIKAIMLRSYLTGTGGLGGINQVKIAADQDKFIVLDQRDSDLQRLITYKNPPMHYKHIFYACNGDTIYPLLKQDEQLHLTPEAGDTLANYLNYGVGQGTLALYTAGSAETSDKMICALVHGWLPYASAFIDMGEYDNPLSWLDATIFNSLKATITNNSASGLFSLVLQQEHIYI